MENSILVYCHYIGGHQLEYIHHLYMYACSHMDWNFAFVVPERFRKDSLKMKWPECNNVTFSYLENEVKQNTGNIIKQSYFRCKELSNAIVRYNANIVILINLIAFLPFLPFFVNKQVKVRGIIYRIYIYEWSEEGFFKKCQDALKYVIMSKSKVFERVYLLNDHIAPKLINKKFHTEKFSYLPDPVFLVDEINEEINIRETYSIPQNKFIILHPGGMLGYKGTIEILKALTLLDKNILERFVFIFAGRVSNDIKEEFIALKNGLESKASIIIIDGFIPFSLLAALFKTCDRVLIPYKVKSQSSGIVCHAAAFKKPVIAVRGGVIGRTVRDYHLGHLIKHANSEDIATYLVEYPDWNYSPNQYVERHSVESFNNHIFLS